jgi:metal-sulfur cluster biosynthetic enzyme
VRAAQGMTRAQKAAKKALAEILRDWKEPHGAGSIMDERWLCGLNVNEEGVVTLQIRPSRPHCPCCLVDLSDLKSKLEAHKRISGAQIEVVDVPDAHRWTEAINN